MDNEIHEKWKYRFGVFEEMNSGVKIPSYGDALPYLSFPSMFKVKFNVFALFFGFIYLCILGLWKKKGLYCS